MTSEGEALILQRNSTEIRSDEKITNSGSKGLLLTTKLYQSANGAALLDPKKREPERRSAIHTEGMVVKKQDNTKNK